MIINKTGVSLIYVKSILIFKKVYVVKAWNYEKCGLSVKPSETAGVKESEIRMT
jgi:hypothetical protein